MRFWKQWRQGSRASSPQSPLHAFSLISAKVWRWKLCVKHSCWVCQSFQECQRWSDAENVLGSSQSQSVMMWWRLAQWLSIYIQYGSVLMREKAIFSAYLRGKINAVDARGVIFCTNFNSPDVKTIISFTCFQAKNATVSAEIILCSPKSSLSHCFVCVMRGAAGRNKILFLSAGCFWNHLACSFLGQRMYFPLLGRGICYSLALMHNKSNHSSMP